MRDIREMEAEAARLAAMPSAERAAYDAALLAHRRTLGLEPSVLEEIATERRRQVEVEGWTPEHDDDHHKGGELARAAAVYAVEGGRLFTIGDLQVPFQVWPYRWEYNPKDRRRDLIRAGALIVAEIERLDRAALIQPQGEERS